MNYGLISSRIENGSIPRTKTEVDRYLWVKAEVENGTLEAVANADCFYTARLLTISFLDLSSAVGILIFI